MVEMVELLNDANSPPIKVGTLWTNLNNDTIYIYNGKEWVEITEAGEPLQRS